MDEETKKHLEEMSLEEQKARFHELRKRLGVAEPTSIVGWRKPLEASFEEYEEYQFLKRRLGYR
jgi:hypothetical protein